MDWFITDHLGSTKLLIDQNGTHKFTGDDDPFGINLRSFGDKDSHRYTGQILDEEQGVYYYGARYYLPEIGRFLSGDPGKEFASSYVYSGNSPIDRLDPTGEFSTSVHEWIFKNYLRPIGFSQRDIEFISAASSNVDGWLNGGQSQALSYMHAMTGRGQTVVEAKKMAADHYQSTMRRAVNLELGIGVGKSHLLAMSAFGVVGHLVTDFPSPEHGFKQWDGLLSPHAGSGVGHHFREVDAEGKPNARGYRPPASVKQAGAALQAAAQQFRSLVNAGGKGNIPIPSEFLPTAAEIKEHHATLVQRAIDNAVIKDQNFSMWDKR